MKHKTRFYPEFRDLEKPDQPWTPTGVQPDDEDEPANYEDLPVAVNAAMSAASKLEACLFLRPSTRVLVRIVARTEGKPDETVFGVGVGHDLTGEDMRSVQTSEQLAKNQEPNFIGSMADFAEHVAREARKGPKQQRPMQGPGSIQA